MKPADRDAVVEVVDVEKSYGSTKVIDGLNFQIMSGDVYALIGRSGSGKSTILRCINGLEPIQGGTIRVRGEAVDFRNEKKKRQLRRHVAIVFQSFNLFPHMTAKRNIMLGPVKGKGTGKKQAEEKAVGLLESIGLADKADAYPGSLSGGQRQRVAIARALAMEPDVLLLDEITSSLDPELTHEVLDLVARLAEQGITIVMVSHEMQFIRNVSNVIAFLEDGRIVQRGSPDEVFNSSDERVRTFLKQVA